MRAYLSTGTGHAEDGSRYVCGLNVESAMAEARAILAETEPRQPVKLQWSTYHASLYAIALGRPMGARMHADMECGRALAEALAGFVGEGN